jgi:hypothetical protein
MVLLHQVQSVEQPQQIQTVIYLQPLHLATLPQQRLEQQLAQMQ